MVLKTKIETENPQKLKQEMSGCEEIRKFSYEDGEVEILGLGDVLHVSEALRKMESVEDFFIKEDDDESLDKVKKLQKRRGRPAHEIMDNTFMCNRLILGIDKEKVEGERCPFCNQPIPILKVKK